MSNSTDKILQELEEEKLRVFTAYLNSGNSF